MVFGFNGYHTVKMYRRRST